MNSQLKRRTMGSLFVAAIVVGVICVVGRGSRRGVGYYFPTWQFGESTEEQYSSRVAELTNVSRIAPLAIRAMERGPSEFGQRWESVREKLPDKVRSRVPIYLGPSWTAVLWLDSNAGEREVAAGTVEGWKRMDEGLRHTWFLGVETNSILRRREYLPLFRQLADEGDLKAAYLLACYEPVSVGDLQLIARVMERKGPRTVVGHCLLLAERIATLGTKSPALVTALESWAKGTDGKCGSAGGVGLALVDPVRYPPDKLLEPHWRTLPAMDGGQLLEQLSRKEFDRLMLSEWALGFLGGLVPKATNRVTGATFENGPPSAPLFRSLRRFGTNAARLAPQLVPLLSGTDLQKESALTLATVAGPDETLIPLVASGLTNAEAAGPLLVWLTSLGPKARPVREPVRALAEDLVQFPPEVPKLLMDPVIAKRYGLIPDVSQNPAGDPRKPSFRKPSGVRLKATDVCPPSLSALWPRPARGANEAGVDAVPRVDQNVLARLPDSNLAELAKRCLNAMDSDPMRQTR